MHCLLYRLICATGRAAVLLLAVSASAQAQTCSVSMPAMAFGNVNVLGGAAVDTTATLTVTCSGGTGAGQRICISIGAGSANDATSRQMTGPGGNQARYDLYTNAARTILWGSWQTGYNTAGVQLDVAKNSTTNVTVYGRFFGSQQTVVPGSYSATFTANPFHSVRQSRIHGLSDRRPDGEHIDLRNRNRAQQLQRQRHHRQFRGSGVSDGKRGRARDADDPMQPGLAVHREPERGKLRRDGSDPEKNGFFRHAMSPMDCIVTRRAPCPGDPPWGSIRRPEPEPACRRLKRSTAVLLLRPPRDPAPTATRSSPRWAIDGSPAPGCSDAAYWHITGEMTTCSFGRAS